MKRHGYLNRQHDGNIAWLVRPSCRQLFFVYSGAYGTLDGLGATDFLRRSSLGNRNVVLMRDPYQFARFEQGVSSEINSLEALLEWHLEFVESCDHVDEVYCTGNSIGGNSALLFGHKLSAKKVWAFAPADLPTLPVLLGLLNEPNGTTEYEIHYSRQQWFDQAFAEALDGLPGVELIRNEKHGHMMLRGLALDGDLPHIYAPYRSCAAD